MSSLSLREAGSASSAFAPIAVLPASTTTNTSTQGPEMVPSPSQQHPQPQKPEFQAEPHQQQPQQQQKTQADIEEETSDKSQDPRKVLAQYRMYLEQLQIQQRHLQQLQLHQKHLQEMQEQQRLQNPTGAQNLRRIQSAVAFNHGIAGGAGTASQQHPVQGGGYDVSRQAPLQEQQQQDNQANDSLRRPLGKRRNVSATQMSSQHYQHQNQAQLQHPHQPGSRAGGGGVKRNPSANGLSSGKRNVSSGGLNSGSGKSSPSKPVRRTISQIGFVPIEQPKKVVTSSASSALHLQHHLHLDRSSVTDVINGNMAGPSSSSSGLPISRKTRFTIADDDSSDTDSDSDAATMTSGSLVGGGIFNAVAPATTAAPQTSSTLIASASSSSSNAAAVTSGNSSSTVSTQQTSPTTNNVNGTPPTASVTKVPSRISMTMERQQLLMQPLQPIQRSRSALGLSVLSTTGGHYYSGGADGVGVSPGISVGMMKSSPSLGNVSDGMKGGMGDNEGSFGSATTQLSRTTVASRSSNSLVTLHTTVEISEGTGDGASDSAGLGSSSSSFGGGNASPLGYGRVGISTSASPHSQYPANYPKQGSLSAAPRPVFSQLPFRTFPSAPFLPAVAASAGPMPRGYRTSSGVVTNAEAGAVALLNQGNGKKRGGFFFLFICRIFFFFFFDVLFSLFC
jgi:hypothetical protein